MQKVDLTGKKFSMLTVLEEIGTAKRKTYLCKCDCGKELFRSYSNLTAKKNTRQSCGCMKAKWASDLKITHGRRIGGKYDPLQKRPERLRKIWSGMKTRCVNSGIFSDIPNHKEYKEKSISLCNEWFKFKTFKEWALSNGYSDELSIDRIDNNGNYEPSNCRWTTSSIQSQNTKQLNSKNKSGYRGVSYTNRKSPWRAMVYLDNKVVFNKSFSTAEEAAIARDMFIVENNLEHTLNFTHTQLETRQLAEMINNVLY